MKKNLLEIGDFFVTKWQVNRYNNEKRKMNFLFSYNCSN